MAHYYAPLVATVAIDKFRFGSLKLLHFPFQWGVWVTLLAALLVHGVVYVWRWRVNGLQVLELLLGVTVVRLPRTWMQRIIYAHWMYGSIPLRVVYQSLLFHFIRLQLFESLPNSFEQLLDQHFRGLCTSSMLGMLREVPHLERIYESFESISSPYDEAVLDALHQRGDTRLFAITGLDTTNAYLWATNRQSEYHILTQYSHRSHTTSNRGQDQQQVHQLDGIYIVMGALYALSMLIFGAELLCHQLTIV
ncbi:uncharacterized protein LOC6565231 [Drosophila grimshawi]|nr:uncharacterized protein LOC6565231 [Drosophila grimshawi]